MGMPLAGDCDRLTLFRGPSATASLNSYIRRLPSFLVSGEVQP
ncbi:hypothetical protein GGR46_001243 [Sphingomonas kyeonggiensis]|uniref:Uncharacterized protein n=1 Tax=Sphingomonas kyeonggiensis TaxID=1268553 RepID=A0A7W6JQJ7_9SPHN|nr:hypothetical protein [Sphingomonas kyeonggiensis]